MPSDPKEVVEALDDDGGDGQAGEAVAAEPVGLPAAPEGSSGELRARWSKATALIEKAARMLPALDHADRVEVEEVVAALREALIAADEAAIGEHSDELADILFYLE